MGDEADALSDRGSGLEADSFCMEQELDDMLERYNINKTRGVGDKMICPTCERPIIKTSYQHVFCSNKRSGNCKDRFHNLMDESRQTRVW